MPSNRLTNQMPKYSPVRPPNTGWWRTTCGCAGAAKASTGCAGTASVIVFPP